MNEQYYGTELAYKNGFEAGKKEKYDLNFSEENLAEMKAKGMSEKDYLNFLLTERKNYLSAKITKR